MLGMGAVLTNGAPVRDTRLRRSNKEAGSLLTTPPFTEDPVLLGRS